ncbi:MAG: hypothetical protein AAGE52_39600 [Myxococcota bacterium]
MVVRALLLLCVGASVAGAQDINLTFEDYRAPGQVRYMRSGSTTLVRSDRLALVRVNGGRVATDIGSFPGASGRLLLMGHRAGLPYRVVPLALEGRDLEGQGEALPDGGMLVFGSNDEVDRRTQGMVARFDGDGRVLWRRQVEAEGPARCRPSETICGFVTSQRVVVRGEAVWVSGTFKRGELTVDGVRYRGRRYMNGFLMKLDLRDGRVVWARMGGGGDDNLGLRGEELVHWEGRGNRRWAQHVSVETGRPTRRVNLQIEGSIQSFTTHGDGYAGVVETHLAAERRNIWHLVGWNAEGQERFRIPAHTTTVVRSEGANLLITEARSPTYRDVGYVSPGVRVRLLDVQGQDRSRADFGGWWFLRSLQPELRHGRLMLSGVLADGERYTITSRAPAPLRPGTPPGHEPPDVASSAGVLVQ